MKLFRITHFLMNTLLADKLLINLFHKILWYFINPSLSTITCLTNGWVGYVSNLRDERTSEYTNLHQTICLTFQSGNKTCFLNDQSFEITNHLRDRFLQSRRIHYPKVTLSSHPGSSFSQMSATRSPSFSRCRSTQFTASPKQIDQINKNKKNKQKYIHHIASIDRYVEVEELEKMCNQNLSVVSHPPTGFGGKFKSFSTFLDFGVWRQVIWRSLRHNKLTWKTKRNINYL